MINITGTTQQMTASLADTTIGTCQYRARVFEFAGVTEVLHDVESINGTKLQWVTTAFSLMTFEADAVAKVAELRPVTEPNPQLPPPEGMSETDKLAW